MLNSTCNTTSLLRSQKNKERLEKGQLSQKKSCLQRKAGKVWIKRKRKQIVEEEDFQDDPGGKGNGKAKRVERWMDFSQEDREKRVQE